MRKISTCILYLFLTGFLLSCDNSRQANNLSPVPDTIRGSATDSTGKIPPVRSKTDPATTETPDSSQIRISVFKNSPQQGGFGYDIFIREKLLVHQTMVPGRPGTSGFNTEEGAGKTARLVAKKILDNIMPPTVTAHELDSLGI